MTDPIMKTTVSVKLPRWLITKGLAPDLMAPSSRQQMEHLLVTPYGRDIFLLSEILSRLSGSVKFPQQLHVMPAEIISVCTISPEGCGALEP